MARLRKGRHLASCLSSTLPSSTAAAIKPIAIKPAVRCLAIIFPSVIGICGSEM
jgi:hypothetical protein